MTIVNSCVIDIDFVLFFSYSVNIYKPDFEGLMHSLEISSEKTRAEALITFVTNVPSELDSNRRYSNRGYH